MIYDYLHDFHHNRHCYHGHDRHGQGNWRPGARNWPWPARARPLKNCRMTFWHFMKLDQRTNRSTKNYDTWWYFRILCDTLQNFTILCDILWYFLISFVLHFVGSPVATTTRWEVCWMRWSRWRRSTFLPWWRNSFKKEARRLWWCHEVGMMEWFILGISRYSWLSYLLHLMGSYRDFLLCGCHEKWRYHMMSQSRWRRHLRLSRRTGPTAMFRLCAHEGFKFRYSVLWFLFWTLHPQ